MLIIDLIKELQAIRDACPQEWINVAGEPEIMIDTFSKDPFNPNRFVYEGFDKDVSIDKSCDGVYHI